MTRGHGGRAGAQLQDDVLTQNGYRIRVSVRCEDGLGFFVFALGLLCAQGTLAGIPGPKVGGFQGIPRDSKGFLAENVVVHIHFT